jgi:O-antigen/teichoic acid export membrane protein
VPGPLTLDPARRRLLRNAGWLLASDGTVLGAELLGTLIAARGLGAAEFGRLNLVWSVVGVAHLLVDIRVWEAVTRYLSEFTSRRRIGVALATLKLALLVEAVVALLGFGLVWLTSGWVATRLFRDPALQTLILLGSVRLVASAFDKTARAVLRVLGRFRTLGLCSVIEALTRLLLVVGALAAGSDVRGVLGAYVASDVIGALILLTVTARAVRAELWRTGAGAGLGVVRPYWRGMLAFVGHSSARATLKVVTRRLDLILLGHFRSPGEVGVYGAALRLARVLEDLSDPLYFAAFPQLARAWVKARDQFVRLVRWMALSLGALSTAVVILGLTGAPLIVALGLGEDYTAAVGPFRLLLIATGVAVATLWATPAILGSGQPGVATTAAVVSAGCLAVLLVTLVPTWGATGAAWAQVGGALGYLVVVLPWLRRVVRRRVS